MEQEKNTLDLGRYGQAGLLVGIVCLIASLVMMFAKGHMSDVMTQSYVFSYIFWLTIALGCFGFTLLQHCLQAKWGLSLLRIFEGGGGAKTMLVMGVLFIPILMGANHMLGNEHHLFHWTDTKTVLEDPVLSRKVNYLNIPFFTIRAIAYFLIWIGLASFLRNSARKQDQNGDKNEQQKRANVASPGIVAFVFTVTFAFTDWVMSLDPHWYSTMFGVWFVCGMALGGLSLATYLACRNGDKEPYSKILNPDLTRDWGNLLFAFTMLWAYTTLSQYLIIWNGNIPEYARYYATRSHGGWNYIGLVLILGQFFIPWFYLLRPDNKKTPGGIAKIAAWIFVMHLIDVYLVVIPVFPNRSTPMPSWTDFLALIGIGGFWLWAFASQIRKAPLVPTYDSRLTLSEEAHHA